MCTIKIAENNSMPKIPDFSFLQNLCHNEYKVSAFGEVNSYLYICLQTQYNGIKEPVSTIFFGLVCL